jgi:hypothetical protein
LIIWITNNSPIYFDFHRINLSQNTRLLANPFLWLKCHKNKLTNWWVLCDKFICEHVFRMATGATIRWRHLKKSKPHSQMTQINSLSIHSVRLLCSLPSGRPTSSRLSFLKTFFFSSLSLCVHRLTSIRLSACCVCTK